MSLSILFDLLFGLPLRFVAQSAASLLNNNTSKSQALIFSTTTLVMISASAWTISLYPYSKLYHDLRGGLFKLLSFMKINRFLIVIVEGHFDDYNIERLKEFKFDPLQATESLLLMVAYNSSLKV